MERRRAGEDTNTQILSHTHTRHTNAHALRQDGRTGLMVAAEKGHEAVVRLLLERGAEVDKANKVCVSCSI